MQKNLVYIAFICMALASCRDDVQVNNLSGNCKSYVDLYAMNYDSLKSDPIHVSEYKINGDCLELNVSYGGCSANHPIDLARIHPWCGTPPLPPPTFEVRHDSRGELCKMLVTETRYFDLKSMRSNNAKSVKFILNYKTDVTNIKSVELEYKY